MIDKKFRRILKRACKMFPRVSSAAAVHYTINERAQIAAAMARAIEAGKIAWIESGMDCDCTRFRSVTIRDAETVFATARAIERAYYWADGPLSIGFARPSEVEESYSSRDLAAEAFENGHAHCVHA